MSRFLNIDDKITLLPDLFSRYPEIVVVFLFGSYGTDFQHDLSDIDFAVYFSQDVNLKFEANLLGKLSSVLNTDRIDLVNLNKAPLNLQFKAVAQEKIIYESDFIATCDYIENMLKRYHDFAIDLENFYLDYDYALKEAVK